MHVVNDKRLYQLVDGYYNIMANSKDLKIIYEIKNTIGTIISKLLHTNNAVVPFIINEVDAILLVEVDLADDGGVYKITKLNEIGNESYAEVEQIGGF
ncbi:hypothetical protein JXA27_06735 [Aerococcaceae bacterium zg-B36]|uniref:hypothetical protein n=1 Tax=Aerococcaceae bacterium zg-252 TaxID=2796928 RepID=UPI001BD8E38A|nr:hypothetical protein [Aerococcaceae bacterium zg-B36]